MSGPSPAILDHLNHPRNARVLDKPDAVGHSCLEGGAPRVTLYLRILNGTIDRIGFQAFGCGYSIACCSALTELIQGLSLDACLSVSDRDVEAALGGLPGHKRFCAEMAAAALHDALAQLRKEVHAS